jgi:hypothetical protein
MTMALGAAEQGRDATVPTLLFQSAVETSG